MKTETKVETIPIDFRGFEKQVNPCYKKYWNDFRRYQVFMGGGSAGKSVFIAQRFPYRLLKYPGYNVLVIRKISATNHDTTFPEIKKQMRRIKNWEDLFSTKESKGDEEIKCLTNGNKIIFKGLDDAEKIKSITFDSGDLTCIWVEEASDITEEDFNQLDIRLRGISKYNKHIILSFNPVESDSWLKKRFFDNVLDKKLGFISQTTYKDNIFIDEAAKAVLENLMNVDYYYYTVYCLGQWGNRSGTKVFFNLSIHDFDFGESLYKNRRGGLDFGFNHAQALIRSGYIDGELYIYREIWKKGMLNKDFISEAEKVWEKDFPINAESANPDKITEWLNAGYMVNPVKKGPNSLKMGVDFLKAIPKIHINKTSCPNCANEFDKFKYRQYKDGRISDNEYVEIDDDTVAATRYANEEFFINGVEEGAGNPVYLGRLY